jgi:hypothetical protein
MQNRAHVSLLKPTLCFPPPHLLILQRHGSLACCGVVESLG